MNHAPDAGLIAGPVYQQSSELPPTNVLRTPPILSVMTEITKLQNRQTYKQSDLPLEAKVVTQPHVLHCVSGSEDESRFTSGSMAPLSTMAALLVSITHNK